MAIKIGHASIDENGKAHGGTAGDSTGKEVCTRNWYNGGWHTVLRPKSATVAEKSAKACEAGCANKKIGYDQYQRNNLHKQAKAVGFDLAKIATACECDCSSFMQVCAIAGGANLPYGSNGLTTRNMMAGFMESGDYEKLTDSKYLTSDKYLKRGDILVKNGHTVMVLENGENITSEGENTVNIELTVLKKGAEGEQVKTLQRILHAMGYGLGSKNPIDGDFGAKTDTAVRTYQKLHNLTVDGVVGQKTWNKLLKG